ncbi:TIGR03084 family metal-binding protein [Nocardiopsis sp. YSL2]|uniref:TIGR03084 family metal-binding protein n=1 Tax=Nocardiopsis sp. YSL2 TaxID=2939492 RepID=UPI0026F4414C|nr:TIGR03084 family metal-binding protein [Nocardiopsis sp. YSL2]
MNQPPNVITQLPAVIEDLAAEAAGIDALVEGLDPADWARETPAQGWTVAHQVAHLCFVFRLAGTAASDAEAFRAMTDRAGGDLDGAVNAALATYPLDDPEKLLARWRADRDFAVEALAAAPADRPVPWLVRPIPPGVLACAGMMEVFAHGQDIADALGAVPRRTDRIGSVVGFAVLTWEFGYESRGLTPPDTEFRYELTSPSGQKWEFGPADAEQRITGDATDFCLLVTRRRHPDDLDVAAVGADAEHWIRIAQAYRGPAGPGRSPGQFDG